MPIDNRDAPLLCYLWHAEHSPCTRIRELSSGFLVCACKGPCRCVGAKLMSRASSMEWREPLYLRKNLLSLETLSGLYVLRNRRKAHSNTSSKATHRGTVETRWPPGHVIVRTYMPIGNRDASLLSMACLALAINCTRI